MKTYLKIKIKSLAEEARIIKREERRWWKHTGTLAVKNNLTNKLEVRSFFKKDHPLVFGLREHRIHVVRTECRHSHIAYGYLRGRAYKQIENKCYLQPDWNKVRAIITKFNYSIFPDTHTPEGRQAAVDKLKEWAAKDSIKKAA